MQALFLLVQSLTKEEKEFFSRMLPSFAPKAEAALGMLYGEIEKRPEPEEDKIKAKLAKSGHDGNYSRLKKQLYETLMSILTIFYEGQANDLLFNQHWSQVQVLLDKELFDIAEKQLYQLLAFCDDAELLTQKVQVLFLIVGNYRLFKLHPAGHTRAHYTEEIAKTNERINDLLEARINLDAIYDLIENRTRSRNEEHEVQIRKIVSKPFFSSASNRQSFLATHFHYFALFWAYTALRDRNKRLATGLAWVQFVDGCKHPEYYSRQALFAYMKVMETLSEHEDWAGYKALLDKMMALPLNSSYAERRRKEAYLRIAATYYINVGEHDMSSKIVDECHRYYTNPKNKPLFVPETFMSMAQISFYLSNYDKVVDICNDFFKLEKQIIRKDLRAAIRMFYLFAQYEIGNAEIVDDLIRTSERYMKEEDLLFDYEKMLLRFLKKMIKVADKLSLNKVCTEFVSELKNHDKLNIKTNFHLHELIPGYFQKKTA